MLLGDNLDKKTPVLAAGIESSKRPVEILKPQEGYRALRDLVTLYFTKTITNYCLDNELSNWEKIDLELRNDKISEWVNVGGQLIKTADLDAIKQAICIGNINSWDELHNEYKKLGNQYPLDKARHAYAALSIVLTREVVFLNKDTFIANLKEGLRINESLSKRTFESRKKDYENPFRQMVYDTNKEMEAVVGELDKNSFIEQTNKEAKDLIVKVETLIQKILTD